MKYIDEEKVLGLIFGDSEKSAKESLAAKKGTKKTTQAAKEDYTLEERGDFVYFDDEIVGLSPRAKDKDTVTIDDGSIGSLEDLPDYLYSKYSKQTYSNLKTVNLGTVTVMESNFLKLCCPNLESVANIDYNNYEEQDLFYYGALAELPKLEFLRVNSNNIYEGAFNSNHLLEEVELGHSVDTIPVRAFENCSALINVTFTPALSSIEENAFSGCTSLQEIICEDDEFTKEDWDNLNIDPTAFTGVPRDCKVVLYDDEFPLFDDGSSASVAKESFDGAIPAPFNKYYDVVDAEELVKDYGYDTIAEYLKENAADGETYVHGLYGVEDEPHLGCKHIAWLRAKPEYIDKLGNNSLDVVELAERGSKKYLSQMVRDNSIRVDEEALSLIKGSAEEEAEGNIDEANRLRAEADRLEKLEDNSGGRVDYSDEVNELETKAAKEGSAPSSTEELTAHQESVITADAEKLFKQYLKENNLTEDDIIGKDFMKILDYIMKNSSTELAEEATVDTIPQSSIDREAAKEAFAKSRRSFKR